MRRAIELLLVVVVVVGATISIADIDPLPIGVSLTATVLYLIFGDKTRPHRGPSSSRAKRLALLQRATQGVTPMRTIHNVKKSNGFTYSALDVDEVIDNKVIASTPRHVTHQAEKVKVTIKPSRKRIFVPGGDAEVLLDYLLDEGWVACPTQHGVEFV
jgi:hypothetical protein